VTKKIHETQVYIEAKRMSIGTRTQSFLGTITDTREHLHEELQVNTQTTKALIEATQHKFQTQLKEVEAWAEHGTGTGTSAIAAKPPNFDGTTSWAVFWCCFKIVCRAQLLDMPGEINILDCCLAGLGHQCASRSPKRCNI
jgi:hypothetical protein